VVITPEQRDAVSRAVAEAERGTSGEIVPVVAARSGRYDRAEDLVGMCVAVAALVAIWFGFPLVAPGAGEWGAPSAPRPGLPWIVAALVGGFAAGIALATRFPALRRPFVGGAHLDAEVERSAAAAFHAFRVRRTRRGTGVLLYVSLEEHVVRVLGDEAIDQALSAADWERVRDAIPVRVRAGDLATGLIDGIREAGELLREHFPSSEADNELHNELRVI